MIQSMNSIDIQLPSSETIYKQDVQFNTITQTKVQDPKSLIKIGQVNQYLRALPHQTSGFYRYIFLCLFNIFRQWHVIYFIVFCKVIAKTFFLCNFHQQAMISELVLIVIYLVLQIYLRYKTYSSYILTQERLKENTFEIWDKQQNNWINLAYNMLKPGQIIKVKSTIDNNNVLNPVNMLPIYLPSRKNHFQLKTTKFNKFQQIKQIPMFQVFKKIVYNQDLNNQIISKLNKVKILFQYTIQNSNVFQGRLKIDQSQMFYFSNKFILQQGVPIINQDFIIGAVLVNLSDINQKSLKRALNAQNQTILKTGKTLIPLAILFLAIAILTFILQFLIIITSPTKRNSLTQSSTTYLCLILGIISILSYFIYIGMFIFLLIHRLRDSYVLKQKSQILIKNHIKSIDEFGQTNTIIMDDYFFIDKNLFQVEDMIYNIDSDFQFDQQLIYSIIEKSQLLKEEMYDLWISTFRYFKNRPRRYTKVETQYKVQIMKQKIFKQSLKFSTITLAVQIRDDYNMQNSQSINAKRFVFRFTQKPKYTSIQRIKNQKLRVSAKQLIKNKDLLHIMMQMMRVDINSFEQDNEAYQLISRTYQPSKFQFLALISHKINSNPYIFPLSLIKNEQIIKKQNLIILSSKKWKYIQILLQKNKINSKHTVSLEQKQFQNIKFDIQYHIRQFKQTIKDQKHGILAIHCNFVSYLSNPQIVRGLIKLARYSKYIIFYNCSQYQKQVCCMNLFEIFPLHIYLSNYLCDIQLIQKSNLSVCQKGQSTQPYVTLVVKTYKDLQYLILNQAVQSINITVFIIKSFLFKNCILIVSMIVAQFMVFQGNNFQLGVQYTGVVFLTYNIITSFPVLFYIFQRPQVWQQPIYKNFDPNKLFKMQYITQRKVIKQFIRAVLVAAFITILNYSFLMSTSIQNLYFSILTSCVIATGYYQLFIDDALQKRRQVMFTSIMYIIFYLLIYFLQFFNTQGFHIVMIQTNLTSQDTVYFFISNFAIVPFILGVLFYGMSAFNARIQAQQHRQNYLSQQLLSMSQIPAKTIQQFGKQLHFRQF